MLLIKNFLSLSLAELIGKLLTFAAFAYLARVAGPEGFGFVEFAGAMLLCASLIVDQGFGPYGAREIARAPERTPMLVAEIVTARFALAVGAYLLVIAFALLVESSPIVMRLMLIYGLSLLAMPLLLPWVFQGHDRMHTVAVVQIIRQTMFAAAVFAFVREAEEVWLIAVAEVIAVCSAAGFSVWAYRRQFNESVRLKISVSKQLFREGASIGLSQMFWAVKMFGATLIVGVIAMSAEDVGYFAGAMRILIAVHTFVWLYYFNLLPSLTRAWKAGPATLAELTANSLRIIAWAGAATAVAWVLVAPWAIVAVYGPSFAPAGATLQWFAGVYLLAAISGHYRFGLIAANRQATEMAVSAIGAAAALILVPIAYFTWGTTGAGAALCAAEATIWMGTWLCGRRLLGLCGHLKILMRPALAAAATLLVWWWLFPRLVMGARVTLAVATLACAAIIFDHDLRKHLRELFERRIAHARQWSAKALPEAML